MDYNCPSNSGNVEEEDVWFLFMSTLYKQIKACKRAIRYNSVLTRHDRMMEFIHGHEERIFNRMRMTRDCFNRFVSLLEGTSRLQASRSVSVSEEVMIFLYTVGHAVSNHDSQEG